VRSGATGDSPAASAGQESGLNPTELAREARNLAERMQTLPRAYAAPVGSATLRAQPADFVVEEELGFEPSAAGEHLWLWIEKCGLNTEQVARALAKLAAVPLRDIGFAGLKDRHAITRQWFSVPWAAGREIVAGWAGEGWTVLRQQRHGRKLRRGTLAGNRFTILLREMTATTAALQSRLAAIAAGGVPNYFTEQRFGYDNLGDAAKLFAGQRACISPHQRGLLFSAARSALFNVVLAQRVQVGTWRTLLAGDAVQLAGSNSFFVATEIDAPLEARVQAKDIAPTGPLWGRGRPLNQGAAAAFEQQILAAYPAFSAGLVHAGLDQARRSLVVFPQDFSWQQDASARSLTLRFVLPAGAYATAVVREIVEYILAARRPAG